MGYQATETLSDIPGIATDLRGFYLRTILQESALNVN